MTVIGSVVKSDFRGKQDIGALCSSRRTLGKSDLDEELEASGALRRASVDLPSDVDPSPSLVASLDLPGMRTKAFGLPCSVTATPLQMAILLLHTPGRVLSSGPPLGERGRQRAGGAETG